MLLEPNGAGIVACAEREPKLEKEMAGYLKELGYDARRIASAAEGRVPRVASTGGVE